jgi:hypothetical protein
VSRCMERVSWKDKKMNEEILATVGEDRYFVKAVVMRNKNWLDRTCGKGRQFCKVQWKEGWWVRR